VLQKLSFFNEFGVGKEFDLFRVHKALKIDYKWHGHESIYSQRVQNIVIHCPTVYDIVGQLHNNEIDKCPIQYKNNE